MKFTKWGRILAMLAIGLGILRIAMAVFVLLTDDPATATRMLLGSKSTGHYMDQGMYSVVFGVLLGVLTDISRSLGLLRKEMRQDHTD